MNIAVIVIGTRKRNNIGWATCVAHVPSGADHEERIGALPEGSSPGSTPVPAHTRIDTCAIHRTHTSRFAVPNEAELTLGNRAEIGEICGLTVYFWSANCPAGSSRFCSAMRNLSFLLGFIDGSGLNRRS